MKIGTKTISINPLKTCLEVHFYVYNILVGYIKNDQTF